MLDFIDFSLDNFASLLLIVVWLGFMRSVRYTGYGIAVLSLCATALHEGCHWLIGLIVNAKPVSVSLRPKRQGNMWILGSVGFRNLNVWNAVFVAFAPLVMLPLGWLLAKFWLLPAFSAGDYLSWFMAGYVVACCVYGCWPSVIDVKAGALSASMYTAIAFFLWCLAQWGFH